MSSHTDIVVDQFTQQATPFAASTAMRDEEALRLLVDFSGVEFVSSAGLRAVLALVKKVKAVQGALALCAVQPAVREVLEITGFAGMIDIHPERAAALSALS